MSALPDLDSLKLLVDVGELGSLGRAARAAGIAQPSASKRIALLERRLGLPLLERTPRGSTLTAEGKMVAGWAAQVLGAAQELMRAAQAVRLSEAAHLRVASSMTVAEYLVPRWLGELQHREPDVQVGLDVVNSADVAARVLAGEVELGFVEGPTVPDGLAVRVVGTDRLVVVVAPAHPWARRRTVLRGPELAATPLVVREPGSGTRETLDVAFAAMHRASPRLELGSNSAVKGAAQAGVAPAVLSGYAVESDVATGRLVEVPLTGVNLVRSLRAVWRRGRPLTGPAATLLAIASRP
ncbi:Transcriptional regulator, LysR family [[Actinomadura] parvosata subsp. kistnae]|uniref:LysR family transcriptional regulator n=2 Tax=Nonomuraea TaxID=83681 RepID=A0A1U9ZRE1_9ACTN|nr:MULTISPECIES: LysR family transcriptional regulator [unclassified Nonomuraea]AQZ60508.1 LysR family transcriptional regulator [Nonomuraea sp. ATCC 55076]NJP89092.1 LysR family transcriptional regulator [Nonomuraea sp. FMUSA5-5]SPL90937.1 Transcriptional regulator, LysR family [Actinomadura parvosata subsp. kistnae]